MIKLYRTRTGAMAEEDGRFYGLGEARWDDLFDAMDTEAAVRARIAAASPVAPPQGIQVLAPLVSQEVWAAGVTYYRSRDARMEESAVAGGGDFYARVYNADRPELFFKATPSRVVGEADALRIRADSKWNVPEPELALAVNSRGRIIGYTIGNDMSSREIEGANPLYLPQAKVYDRCCALGPCVLLSPRMLDASTRIELEITRAGQSVFGGATELAQLKRKPEDLVEYLFRDNVFPNGCFLLTGTGIVPPSGFTLLSGDRVRITIGAIGTLTNTVL